MVITKREGSSYTWHVKPRPIPYSTPAGQSAVLSKGVHFSRWQILLLAVVLALIGIYIIYLSHADTSSGNYLKVNFPTIGIAGAGGTTGYWLVGTDGGIFSQGTARPSMAPWDRPVLEILRTASRRPGRPQRLHIDSPLLVGAGGAQNQIHGAGHLLHGL